jgi:hypothetical protein
LVKNGVITPAKKIIALIKLTKTFDAVICIICCFISGSDGKEKTTKREIRGLPKGLSNTPKRVETATVIIIFLPSL